MFFLVRKMEGNANISSLRCFSWIRLSIYLQTAVFKMTEEISEDITSQFMEQWFSAFL